MKKIVTTFISILLILVLSACQVTPDEVVVVEKDLEKMIEMASEQAAPTEQIEPSVQPDEDSDEDGVNALALRMGAPDHYTDQFTDKTETLSVNVDADIIIPNSDEIEILRVKKSKFTNEMAAKLIDALVHSQLYECTESGVFFSKQGIMDYMMGVRASIAQMEDEEAKENTGSYLENIQYFYDAAPEEKTPISGEFEHKAYPNAIGEWSVSEDVENIFGLAYSEDYGYETFSGRQTVESVTNRIYYTREPNSGVSANGMGEYYTADEIAKSDRMLPGFTTAVANSIPDIAITKEAAITEADAFLGQIGEESFSCFSADKVYGGSWDCVYGGFGKTNPLRCVWRLRYARTVNGILTTYTSESGTSSEEELQAEPWAYEDMVFHIDDSGIVGFGWVSPYEVTSSAVEDVNVKSFDEIMDVFNTMIPVKYVWSENNQKIEMTISEIRLGHTRVTEENERDTGLLIPVWDFFGTCVYNTVDENGEVISSTSQIPPDSSLLTINAIDGSVIDRGLGY